MTMTSPPMNQIRMIRKILTMTTLLWPRIRAGRLGRGRGRGIELPVLFIILQYVLGLKARRFGRISWQEDYEPGAGLLLCTASTGIQALDGFVLT